MQDMNRRGSRRRPRRIRPASAGTDRRARSAAAALTATALLIGLPGLTACNSNGLPPGGSGAVTGPSSAKRPGSPSGPPAPEWNTAPASIAALGDSITRGFDACNVLADCPRVSWSTGAEPQVRSLADRLVKDPAHRSWNHARTGTRMADLPRQVDAAVRHRPELVTVLVGANDACRDTAAQMTPVQDFRADFRDALRRLRRALPKTQVYVASIPDLRRLWSQGRRSPFGKQVWKLGICSSMLGDPDAVDRASTERRRQVHERVVAYNTELQQVCGQDPLCRYDGAVFAYRFTGKELSKWDWFHPSQEGQARLAEIAYRRITARTPAA
jgi:lysophospholipase L1-like esterase